MLSNKQTFRIVISYLITLLIIFPLMGYGQKYADPLSLVKDFFSPEGIKNKENYLSGDALKNQDRLPFGNKISTSIKKDFSLVFGDNTNAEITVLLSDTDISKTPYECYVFLSKENEWKINSIKTYYPIRELKRTSEDLEKATRSEIERNFETKADYNFELSNVNLVIKTNKDIILFFNKNAKTFQLLLNKSTEAIYAINDSVKKIKKNEEINTLMKELLIRNSYIGSDECPECFFFSFYGMLNNAVGIIYNPIKNRYLKQNPKKYLCLIEIGNGWYFYRGAGS